MNGFNPNTADTGDVRNDYVLMLVILGSLEYSTIPNTLVF
jgi:hypothetical protein